MSFLEKLNIAKPLKNKIVDAIEKRVQKRVAARLAQHHLSFDEFSDDELAIIYEDERQKLYDDLKTKGLFALFAALGISIF